tara:strand:- start:173 stop:517 length:345 start_codon:yes stop_codon:yes gene_type:complete
MPPKKYPSSKGPKKVPKGSHRMKDGSIMKDSAMPKKTAKKTGATGAKAPKKKTTTATSRPKKQKFDDDSPMTSMASIPKHVYRVSDLKVEESIKKSKEVKESDIFEVPQNKSRY